MTRNIVFVHLVTNSTVAYSHAIASLSAVIKRELKAINISLVVVRNGNAEEWAEEIAKRNPTVVLFSVMSNQFILADKIASMLKFIAPNALLCIGGPHAMAISAIGPFESFDVSWPYEGENIIHAIASSTKNEKDSLNERLRFIKPEDYYIYDLNSLPFPDLSIFDKEDIIEYPSVMFSRGCPYKCSYCMSRVGGISGKIRWKSPSRAVEEVSDLLQRAQINDVYIDDDTLLKNPNWVKSFCDIYKRKIKAPFLCNARPETITREICEVLASAGCKAIGIGIESGSERVRKEVLCREMSNDRIVRAFDDARKAGLETWSFNMVGIPSESASDFMSTIELNEIVQPNYVRVSIFTPYPGTPVFDAVGQSHMYRGYLRKDNELPSEIKDLFDRWVARLRMEGRLWFTESEEELMR